MRDIIKKWLENVLTLKEISSQVIIWNRIKKVQGNNSKFLIGKKKKYKEKQIPITKFY